MTNNFDINDMIIFKLSNNPTKYALYKHVAEMMDIFNVVQDCPNTHEIIEITWEISQENVNLALCCINNMIIENVALSTYAKIISFLRYVGLNQDMLNKIINEVTCAIDSIKFIDEFVISSNPGDMMFVFDSRHRLFKSYGDSSSTYSDLKCVADKIFMSSLPLKIKMSVTKKIMIEIYYDIMSGYNYSTTRVSSINSFIHGIRHKFGFDTTNSNVKITETEIKITPNGHEIELTDEYENVEFYCVHTMLKLGISPESLQDIFITTKIVDQIVNHLGDVCHEYYFKKIDH